MTPKPIKLPGPDHPITIAPNPKRVVVSIAGRVVADTRAALTLREAGYRAVQYIPRKDVDMSLLQRTDHATYCPYKGVAELITSTAKRHRINQRITSLSRGLGICCFAKFSRH